MIWGYPYFRNPPFESYLNIVLSCFPLGLLKPLLSGNHEPHGWIARNLHSQRQKYNSSKRCRECALAQWAFWCFWVDTHVITRQFCWISMADLSSKVGSLRSVCVETPQIHRLITIYIHIYIYIMLWYFIYVLCYSKFAKLYPYVSLGLLTSSNVAGWGVTAIFLHPHVGCC